jgi:hypothetical protein
MDRLIFPYHIVPGWQKWRLEHHDRDYNAMKKNFDECPGLFDRQLPSSAEWNGGFDYNRFRDDVAKALGNSYPTGVFHLARYHVDMIKGSGDAERSGRILYALLNSGGDAEEMVAHVLKGFVYETQGNEAQYTPETVDVSRKFKEIFERPKGSYKLDPTF